MYRNRAVVYRDVPDLKRQLDNKLRHPKRWPNSDAPFSLSVAVEEKNWPVAADFLFSDCRRLFSRSNISYLQRYKSIDLIFVLHRQLPHFSDAHSKWSDLERSTEEVYHLLYQFSAVADGCSSSLTYPRHHWRH